MVACIGGRLSACVFGLISKVEIEWPERSSTEIGKLSQIRPYHERRNHPLERVIHEAGELANFLVRFEHRIQLVNLTM